MPPGDYEIRVVTQFDASGFQSYINQIRSGLARLSTNVAGGTSSRDTAQSVFTRQRAAAEASLRQMQQSGLISPQQIRQLQQALNTVFRDLQAELKRAGASVVDPVRARSGPNREEYNRALEQHGRRVETAARSHANTVETQARREERSRQVAASRLQAQQRQRGIGVTPDDRQQQAEEEADRRREAQRRRYALQQATHPLDIQRMGYLDANEARQRAQRQSYRLQATTPDDINLQAANQVQTQMQRAALALARVAAIGDVEGGEQAYYQALGQATAAKRTEAAQTRAATQVALAATPEFARASATGVLAQQRVAQQQRVEVLRQQLAMSTAELGEQRQQVALEAQLTQQLNARQRAVDQQMGRGGSPFQRGMAYARTRQTGQYHSPAEQQSLGQFVTQRGIQSAGYAGAGLLLYGGIEQFRMMIEESIQFQSQMAQVRSELQGMGQESSLPQVQQQILNVSSATGATAVEVANLSQQFLGLYQNASQAMRATSQAAQYIEATGGNPEEMGVAFRAGAGAYGLAPGQLANYAAYLNQQTGVAPFGPQTGGEALQFFADLAPTASAFNMSAQQVANLGVATMRYSSQTPANLSGSLARVLPNFGGAQGRGQLLNLGYNLNQSALGGNIVSILQNLLQQTGPGRGQVPLQSLLSSGLVDLRDRQTIEDLFGHPQQALTALNTGRIPGNVASQAESNYQASLGATLRRFEQDVRNAGIALIQSGVSSGLKDILDVGIALGSTIRPALSILQDFNHILGDVPGKLLAGLVAFKAFQAAMGVLGDFRSRAAQLGEALDTLTASETAGAAAAGRDAVAQDTLTTAEVAGVGGAAAREAQQLQLFPTTAKVAREAETAAGPAAGEAVGGAVGGTVLTALGAAMKVPGAFLRGMLPGAVARSAGLAFGVGEGTLFGGGLLGAAAGAGSLISGAGAAALLGITIGKAFDHSRLGHGLANILSGNSNMSRLVGVGAGIADPFLGVLEPFIHTGIHTAPTFQVPKAHQVAGRADWIQGRMGFFNAQGQYTAWAPGQQGNIPAAQSYAQAHPNAANTGGAAAAGAAGTMLPAIADPSTDIQVLQQQYQAGVISWQAYKTKLQQDTANLNKIAQASPTDVNAIQQAAQAQQQENQALDQMLSSQTAAGQALINMTSGNITTLSGVMAANQAQLGVLGTQVQQSRTAAQQISAGASYLSQLQQNLQAAVSTAVNPAQAAQIAARGYQITPQDETSINTYYRALGQPVPAGLQTGQTVHLTPQQQFQVNQQAAAYQQQVTQATSGLQQAEAPGDAVGNALVAQKAYFTQAMQYFQQAQAAGEADPSKDAQFIQDIAQARQAANQMAVAQGQRYSELAQELSAQAFGDPLVTAQAQINAATQTLTALKAAGYSPTSDNVIQAQTQYYQAQGALAQAQVQAAQNEAQLAAAQSPFNAIVKAQQDLKAANSAVDTYRREAQQLVAAGIISNVDQFQPLVQAETQQAQAQTEMLQYQMQFNSAQAGLLQAQYNLIGNRAAGDQAQIQALRQNLQIMQAHGADPAQIAQLQTQITQAQDQYAQDLISQTQTRVQNELSLQQISIGQAVAQLQALEAVATSQQERQALQVQIRQLMQQATSQADLGVPTGGFMPTLYEVRRLAAGAGSFGAAVPGTNLTAPVQNNYVVIQVNNPSDMAGAVGAFANVLSNSPVQTGTRVGVTSP